MPPFNPSPLRCLLDSVTQVRAADGSLLGCVPKLAGDPALVSSSSGTTFEIRFAVSACIYVPEGLDPSALDGFQSVDLRNADLALPLVPPDGADLAEEM